jgi:hypothetical protein
MHHLRKSRDAIAKMQGGFRGFPLITTKLVLSLFLGGKDEPDVLERWFSEDRDVRDNDELLDKILQFVQKHHAKSLSMGDGIIGCPHEEGIDYPEGKSCPHCPYWAGRNRLTGERVH